jgi:hypothetical protein
MCSKEYEEKWNILIAELNDPSKLEDNWKKFCIVDKILCFHGEDEWEGKEVHTHFTFTFTDMFNFCTAF